MSQTKSRSLVSWNFMTIHTEIISCTLWSLGPSNWVSCVVLCCESKIGHCGLILELQLTMSQLVQTLTCKHWYASCSPDWPIMYPNSALYLSYLIVKLFLIDYVCFFRAAWTTSPLGMMPLVTMRQWLEGQELYVELSFTVKVVIVVRGKMNHLKKEKNGVLICSEISQTLNFKKWWYIH